MIVVDTNIICYFFLNTEHSELAEHAFRKYPYWIAPILWRSEFRNVLALYIRKQIISFDDALRIMSDAELLMKGREYRVRSSDILRLVNQSDCSAYDCEFVALAEQFHIPLITTDRKILKNFSYISISLDTF